MGPAGTEILGSGWEVPKEATGTVPPQVSLAVLGRLQFPGHLCQFSKASPDVSVPVFIM